MKGRWIQVQPVTGAKNMTRKEHFFEEGKPYGFSRYARSICGAYTLIFNRGESHEVNPKTLDVNDRQRCKRCMKILLGKLLGVKRWPKEVLITDLKT